MFQFNYGNDVYKHYLHLRLQTQDQCQPDG